MRLRALRVADFGCIENAAVSLADGLNVLYGPNDLGKSTLVSAIRAALLLQHTSTHGADFKPWGTDRVPQVELVLTDGSGRYWRVRKAFSTGRRGSATLEWSNDGEIWTLADKNRGVDGKLRELLAWGVPDAGVKGGRGAPSSFLATILVGPQMQPGAVFNTSLADDKHESGRERLNEALQALAEDPLFKAVLGRAQELVSLAFRKDDKKRTAMDSPFRAVQERIKELADKLRELDLQVISSEHVRTELSTLQAALDQAMTERHEATATALRLESQWSARVGLTEAETELAAIEVQRAAIEKLRDEQHELTADEPTAAAALAKAELARTAAERALADAQRKHEEVEQGGDAEGKLHKQSLQTRRLEVIAERDKIYERLQHADKAIAQQAALEDLADQAQAIAADLAAATEDAQATERARREADAERVALTGALALRRLQEARVRLDEAEHAAREADTLRAAAAERRARAKAMEQAIEVQGLPDTAAVDALRELEQALRLAEARLGGGLALTIRAADPTTVVHVGVDDGADTPLTAGTSVEAERRLTIRVGDGVQLEVVGGEADARRELTRVREGWDRDAAPILLRLSCVTVAELDARRRAADAELARATRERELATSEAERAETHAVAAADREARNGAVERATAALRGLDRAQLEATAGERDEAALHELRLQAEARMEEAARTAGIRGTRVAELRGDADSITRRIAEATTAHHATVAVLGGDANAVAERTRDQHAAAEGKLEQVDAELAELQRRSSNRLSDAAEAVVRAQQVIDEAAAIQAKTRERLDGIKAAIARVSGQLQAQVEAAAAADEGAVLQRVESLRAALAALLADRDGDSDAEAGEATEARVVAARARANAASERVVELDKQLASQRGQLKQVGGNVVLQDRVETEAALQAAHADESELELDYEAYRLLVEVMRETESAEGRHLGLALAGPVRDRFSRLTQGRYGAMELDAQLSAQGLHAAGGVRPIDTLSAGLQEQLATLLRLAVAEQLDSALVLDDHLTQTDPARIEWFRDVLVETAAKTQVVVITCRESDYLDAAGAVPIHAVDLSRAIRRVPTPADLPAAD